MVKWLQSAKRLFKRRPDPLDQLLVNVSHELRTPLNSIGGFSEILIEKAQCDQLPAVYLKFLERIQINQKYMLQIVDNFLHNSMAWQQQQRQKEWSTVDPEKIIEKSFQLVEFLASERGIELAFHRRAYEPGQYGLEASGVLQILVNLLSNALKFTPAHAQKKVEVFLSSAPDQLQFEVVDQGIGIDQTKLQSIFQPFFQAEANLSRRFGGVGLGLSISQDLAKKMGGHLQVHSQKGIGSVFTLHVPTRQVQEHYDLSILKDRRILIVDDSIDNLDLLEVYLGEWGSQAIRAENGKQALDLLLARSTQQPIEAIILDLQMPIMNGFQALRLIRQRQLELPVIILTAHGSEENREQCLKAGANAYFTKPAVPRELARSLVEEIGRIRPSG